MTEPVEAPTETAPIEAPAEPVAVETPAVEAAPVEAAPVEAAPVEAPVAPEPLARYEDFNIAEGVEVNNELMDEFKNMGIESGIDQSQAQKLVDLGAKMQGKILAQVQQSKIDQINAWEQETRNDSEMGGDKLDENLAIAKLATDAFATPELFNVLEETGLVNHPELIRAFYRVGKKLSEDNLVSGSGNSIENKTLAQRQYPDMNP